MDPQGRGPSIPFHAEHAGSPPRVQCSACGCVDSQKSVGVADRLGEPCLESRSACPLSPDVVAVVGGWLLGSCGSSEEEPPGGSSLILGSGSGGGESSPSDSSVKESRGLVGPSAARAAGSHVRPPMPSRRRMVASPPPLSRATPSRSKVPEVQAEGVPRFLCRAGAASGQRGIGGAVRSWRASFPPKSDPG